MEAAADTQSRLHSILLTKYNQTGCWSAGLHIQSYYIVSCEKEESLKRKESSYEGKNVL